MRALKAALRGRHRPKPLVGRNESGIALFMVISAMTILSILVTEFTYVAQVNHRMAYDGLDQLKAYYLAKSGFKLSLLRLKAYQQVKGLTGGSGGGGIPGIPKQLLEKIWSFPFMYPLSGIPGMAPTEKERIAEFEKASGLDGRFSAVIESESSKYNLNSILAGFGPTAQPSPNPSGTPPSGGGGSGAGGGTGDSATGPDAARQGLQNLLTGLLTEKVENDPDFASEYRDVKIEELMDGIISWADRSYEARTAPNQDLFPPKQAPFYSISEMHMLPRMDDQLYELFAPSLTVSQTPGINLNTMKEELLKALVPEMTKEELGEFFKFRDSEEQDNAFKSADDFYKYLQDNVAAFRGDEKSIQALRQRLAFLRFVTDESVFKITVQASVNQATKTLEAWLVMTGKGGKQQKQQQPPADGTNTTSTAGNAGLKVTFMRIL